MNVPRNASHMTSSDAAAAPVSSYLETQQKLRLDPAFDDVFAFVYKDLRKKAMFLRRAERDCILATTELVNETYLKMRQTPSVAQKELTHFKRIAAVVMRQILTDAARRKRSRKGGGHLRQVALDDSLHVPWSWDETMLDLNRKLDELGGFAPRAAEVIEMCYFGGSTVSETAAYLHLSESSINRDLRLGLAWLKGQMLSRDPHPAARRYA